VFKFAGFVFGVVLAEVEDFWGEEDGVGSEAWGAEAAGEEVFGGGTQGGELKGEVGVWGEGSGVEGFVGEGKFIAEGEDELGGGVQFTGEGSDFLLEGGDLGLKGVRGEGEEGGLTFFGGEGGFGIALEFSKLAGVEEFGFAEVGLGDPAEGFELIEGSVDFVEFGAELAGSVEAGGRAVFVLGLAHIAEGV
jgi:hypothetical protein